MRGLEVRALVGAAALLASGCQCLPLSFVGLACDETHPCPRGLLCQDGLCEEGLADAGVCPLDADPAASECAGRTWYLAPEGDAGADGLSPTSPRAALDELTPLGKGDRVVLLAGVYPRPMTLGQSGTATCPILISGPEDGGAVLEAVLEIQARYVVLRELVFAGQSVDDVRVNASAHLTFDRVHFRSRAPEPGAYPRNINSGCCASCAVVDSTFESATGVSVVLVEGTGCDGFELRGNRVVLGWGTDLSFHVSGGVVEGNELSGRFHSDVITFAGEGTGGGVVRRNVFHDLEARYPDKVLIRGAALVESNTFSDIYGAAAPLVVTTRFSDNLVTSASPTVAMPMPDAGDYNVFDPSVEKPWADSTAGHPVSGTDRVASVGFESPSSFIPAAGSAAIDAADPALAVPPGGGARADVGALERGATLAHGRYCILDGGT